MAWKEPESGLRAYVAGPYRVAERERDQPPRSPKDVAESSELTGHLRYPGPCPGRGGRCWRLHFTHHQSAPPDPRPKPSARGALGTQLKIDCHGP
ncbi:hypothetical protein PAL_GLEAN10008459 [Pteropus alecto]|uniref:Uncharacterized protein n=1 Tax=Pteropus alecto TaxID=9402 RepID=L5KAZ9_PTEAL|nr:hypothetical protein PAL_GLEAN10008459 [Pteropus alecto]